MALMVAYRYLFIRTVYCQYIQCFDLCNFFEQKISDAATF
ncbi:hypothetical protein FM042_08490 [Aliidiomarina halalkaliphila]|uniref:Uncharacterized protein n=1 Tax=Aliidiomarina halalkaliphila TaxID=2593535 RepID=A0A552X1T4_9GAMM|nr:hypothetical protein FM042_08490 [Aliidiomarina halalkaliphila]